MLIDQLFLSWHGFRYCFHSDFTGYADSVVKIYGKKAVAQCNMLCDWTGSTNLPQPSTQTDLFIFIFYWNGFKCYSLKQTAKHSN